MDNNQIRRLLAQYFEGNTTLDEEKVLSDFFSSLQDEENEWTQLKKQFRIFKTGREMTFDIAGLESKILNSIDEYESARRPQIKNRKLMFYLMAASFALAVALSGIFFFKHNGKSQDTFTDPQLAYAEVQKTLLYISQTMNKGIEPLDNISKINTSTRSLKNLDKMNKSMEVLNKVSFINQTSEQDN